MLPRLDRSSLLAAAPAAAIIFVANILPLTWMAWIILANPMVRGEFSLNAFRLTLLGRTLGYNAAAAIIAAAMGLPAAFVLGRGRGLTARILWVVLPAAMLMPSLSFAYGWSQFVRLMSSPLGNFLHHFFQPGSQALRNIGLTLVADDAGAKSFLIPNAPLDIFRCIWSLGTWLWAVPACLIGLALRRLDSNVQQQALLDGALHRVTLRQLLGPIVASIAIVTIIATQEFAVYEPTGISVVATEVRMVFDTGSMSSTDNAISAPGYLGAGIKSPDQPARAAAAVATAFPLLAFTVMLAAVAAWGIRRTSAADTLAIGDWPPILDVSLWTLAATTLLVLINIGLPIVALFGSLRIGFMPTRVWAEFQPQVIGAMTVAGEAAAVALIAALFFAARWIPGALALAVATFLVGGQLLAIGLIRIYNRPGLAWAYDISVVPVICYLGRFGWLAVASGKATWSRPWQEIRDLAAADGASTLQAAVHVIWPIAWPTLLAGGLLVGALSLTEVPATVLLMPQNPQVLTPTLMTWVHMARYDPMIEASLLMMGTVLLPAVAAVLLTSFGLRVLRRNA